MSRKVFLEAPDYEFLLPYLKAEGVELAEVEAAEVAIMLSTTDIYFPGGEKMLDEESSVDIESIEFGKEKQFKEFATKNHLPNIILRCPIVIGTRMGGIGRRIAEMIDSGKLFYFPGNEARVSVMHATDLAKVVLRLAQSDVSEAVYNVGDGTNPTFHDLAEALAYRMKNKRVSTLSTGPQQWFGRVFYGKKLYSIMTTSRLYSVEKIKAELGIDFVDTCEYLRTHNYDENSL